MERVFLTERPLRNAGTGTLTLSLARKVKNLGNSLCAIGAEKNNKDKVRLRSFLPDTGHTEGQQKTKKGKGGRRGTGQERRGRRARGALTPLNKRLKIQAAPHAQGLAGHFGL